MYEGRAWTAVQPVSHLRLPKLLMLIGAAILLACAGPEPEPPEETEAPPSRLEGLPQSKSRTVMVEGMPEELELHLFEPPPDFPLRFHTYVPADMVAEPTPVAGNAGQAIRFSANFGGIRRDDVAVTLFVYPHNTTVEAARSMTRQLAEGHGAVEIDEWSYDWSSEEFAFAGADEIGRIAQGERDGRPFYIMVRYPPEFGDGFAPRVNVVIEEWRWADGEPLSG